MPWIRSLFFFFFSFYHVCSYATQFNNYYFSQERIQRMRETRERANERERERIREEVDSFACLLFSRFFFDVHVRRPKVLTDVMRMYARDSTANTERFSLNQSTANHHTLLNTSHKMIIACINNTLIVVHTHETRMYNLRQ